LSAPPRNLRHIRAKWRSLRSSQQCSRLPAGVGRTPLAHPPHGVGGRNSSVPPVAIWKIFQTIEQADIRPAHAPNDRFDLLSRLTRQPPSTGTGSITTVRNHPSTAGASSPMALAIIPAHTRPTNPFPPPGSRSSQLAYNLPLPKPTALISLAPHSFESKIIPPRRFSYSLQKEQPRKPGFLHHPQGIPPSFVPSFEIQSARGAREPNNRAGRVLVHVLPGPTSRRLPFPPQFS